MKKRFLSALFGISSLLSSSNAAQENNFNLHSDDIQELAVEVVDKKGYYKQLREKGKWFGVSDSRDIVLRSFYNRYVREILSNGMNKTDFILDYGQNDIMLFQTFLNEFEKFKKDNNLTNSDIILIPDSVDTENLKYFQKIETYIEELFSLKEIAYLESIEHIASDDFFYSSKNFSYVENLSKKNIEFLLHINKEYENLEKISKSSGKSINGRPHYFYGNVKVSTKRLLTLYSIYRRFNYIESYVENPKISKTNLITENLPAREKHTILYTKKGFPLPILDLGKKNQNLMNLIIEFSKRENISLQLALVIALKENNFGNNFVSSVGAFGPMQIQNDAFFDMMGKTIEQYSDEEKFVTSLEASIKYLAYLKDRFNIDLDFDQKIPKTSDISKLSKAEKNVLANYLKIGSLYYSGIGDFLFREADNGLTPKTVDYLEKVTSSLGYYYRVENKSQKPSIYSEPNYL